MQRRRTDGRPIHLLIRSGLIRSLIAEKSWPQGHHTTVLEVTAIRTTKLLSALIEYPYEES